MMISIPPRDNSPHQDSTRTAPSGTPPPAPPPPPQTRWWWLVYPRETPPHTRTARAQPAAAHRRRGSRPYHHQTRETQFHSAPTPLKRPMLTPERGPRPRVSAWARGRWSVHQEMRCARMSRPSFHYKWTQRQTWREGHQRPLWLKVAKCLLR